MTTYRSRVNKKKANWKKHYPKVKPIMNVPSHVIVGHNGKFIYSCPVCTSTELTRSGILNIYRCECCRNEPVLAELERIWLEYYSQERIDQLCKRTGWVHRLLTRWKYRRQRRTTHKKRG